MYKGLWGFDLGLSRIMLGYMLCLLGCSQSKPSLLIDDGEKAAPTEF